MAFTLAQRLQNTNGLSPWEASVRIVPLLAGSAAGGVLGSIVTGTGRIPPLYIMWTFSVASSIGMAY
jgi:hypothetical protein